MATTHAFRRYSTQTLDQLIPAPIGFESFQKVDSATLGPLLTWALLGTSQFSVNSLTAFGGAAAVNVARAEVELGSADQWASISCESQAPLAMGVALCCSSAADLTCYVAYQENLQWVIGRYTTGAFVSLAASAYTDDAPPVLVGDVIRFVKQENRLTVWHGDRLALTGTDPTTPLTHTRAGIFAKPGARIGQFSCGVGASAGPWQGGIVRPPTVAVSTRDPYFGALEPDEVSFSISNDGWTPRQVLNLRGRPVALESWDVLDAEPPWRAHFYSGTALAGAPIFIREYPAINFRWPTGSPDPAVPTTSWSARFWSLARFHRGSTAFRAESDDGVRLYVDGISVIDSFMPGLHVSTGTITLEAGWHTLEVQFFQQTGAAVLSLAWSPTWSRRIEAFTGVITSPSMNAETITLRCASLNPADLQTEIPKGTVTATDFPLAVDTGKTPHVPVGLAARVPMVYVHRDLENSVYRYVCRREATVVAVYRGWQENFFFVEPFEYTVSTSVYPGYTTLTFLDQQVDISGGDNTIYADLSFPDPAERNPIRVMRQILNDPIWGLGKPYNAASFAAAEAKIEAYGGLYADGFLDEPRAAMNYLRQLMMYRGIRLWVDAIGEYQVSVDAGDDTIVATLQDGLGDGPHNILSMSDIEGTPLLDMVKKFIMKYRRNVLKGDFAGTHSREALSDGQEWTEENIFVDGNETADRILDFLAKTHVSGDTRVSVTIGPEGHIVQAKDLVSLTHRVGFADERMRVVKATKDAAHTTLELRGTSLLDYVYTPGTLPADGFDHSFSDYSRVVPADVTDYSIVVAESGTEAGIDDNMVAYHIIQFTTPVGLTPPEQAYASARIDVKLDGQPFYHTGYATDVGTGVRKVKISGLLPGVGYTYLIVPVTKFGVVGAGVELSGVTPGALVLPSQVGPLSIISTDTEMANDGTVVAVHYLRFITPSGTSINDQIYASARIDVKQTTQTVWHTGYATTNATGTVTVKIGNLSPSGRYDYQVVSLTRLGIASAPVPLLNQLAVADPVTPAQVTGPVSGLPVVFSSGVDPVASDGTFTSWHVLRFITPSAASLARPDVAYASCRIDFRETTQATFHMGYAEVVGRGTLDVKVSGLIPGRNYEYRFVSISTLGTPSSPVTLGPVVAPGDVTGPSPPGTPSLLSQHLREFLFAVSCGSDLDMKELEWEVRTVAGGGTVVATGTAPPIRGGQATIKYTLPVSTDYGVARFIRARLRDNTGNTSGYSASFSFSASRTVTNDYGDSQLSHPKRDAVVVVTGPYNSIGALSGGAGDIPHNNGRTLLVTIESGQDAVGASIVAQGINVLRAVGINYSNVPVPPVGSTATYTLRYF